ncbi:NACHT domain-containing protein [Lewinella sp. IMCC34191]|uniref:NACHT domain-containing protein n=1 Tax=Lewinella sp. IMCC34191 TaxID=2259172 RepID=UPI000E26102B|nr:NACHT domain-containing protein [Lewinella sp. IMCC34191]
MANIEMIQSIAAIISPITDSIVKIFIEPRLAKLDHKVRLQGERISHIISNNFKQYLKDSYKQYSVINTISLRNNVRLLDDIYEPLTLINKAELKFTIEDDFDYSFFLKNKKIIIVDNAGMGKSTVMKKIFTSIIKGKFGVPILIELRRINNDNPILKEISNQLNSIFNEINSSFIESLIEQGNFVLLFDGLDEVPLSDKEFVINEIDRFVYKAPKNVFIMASRDEPTINSFGSFLKLSISPLTREKAYSLLKKYDISQKIANKLIEKLESPEVREISEFLENPLLTSLLFTAFDYKNTIPFKKHLFYRQVYDALFEMHDLSKGDAFTREKKTGLDIDEFHRAVRHLGFYTLRSKRTEFDKDQILKFIKETKVYTKLPFKESVFLEDLLQSVPLLTRDGVYIKWAHKSIQEYFAAQFVYLDESDERKAVLEAIYDSEQFYYWRNFMTIYYAIDEVTFKRVVYLKALDECISIFEKNQELWAQNMISERQIEFRNRLTAGYKIYLVKGDLKGDGNNISKVDLLFDAVKGYNEDIFYKFPLTFVPSGLKIESRLNYIKVLKAATPAREVLEIVRNNSLLNRRDGQVYTAFNTAEVVKKKVKLRFLFKTVRELTNDKNSNLNKVKYFDDVNTILFHSDNYSNLGTYYSPDLKLMKKAKISIEADIGNNDLNTLIEGI